MELIDRFIDRIVLGILNIRYVAWLRTPLNTVNCD